MCKKKSVTLIEDKTREVHLRWFGDMKRRHSNAPTMRKCQQEMKTFGQKGQREMQKKVEEDDKQIYETYRHVL